MLEIIVGKYIVDLASCTTVLGLAAQASGREGRSRRFRGF